MLKLLAELQLGIRCIPCSQGPKRDFEGLILQLIFYVNLAGPWCADICLNFILDDSGRVCLGIRLIFKSVDFE